METHSLSNNERILLIKEIYGTLIDEVPQRPPRTFEKPQLALKRAKTDREEQAPQHNTSQDKAKRVPNEPDELRKQLWDEYQKLRGSSIAFALGHTFEIFE